MISNHINFIIMTLDMTHWGLTVKNPPSCSCFSFFLFFLLLLFFSLSISQVLDAGVLTVIVCFAEDPLPCLKVRLPFEALAVNYGLNTCFLLPTSTPLLAAPPSRVRCARFGLERPIRARTSESWLRSFLLVSYRLFGASMPLFLMWGPL